MPNNREEHRQRFADMYEAGERRVVVIPAKPEFSAPVYDREEIVGAYCRVSTMADEQLESYELQKAYYTEYIAKQKGWTLYDVYADEGISATSTKKRKNFNRMIRDCVDHKLTLIVTKSISRFGRNIIDVISTVRALRNLNPPVGVFFENENIHTLSQSSELQLSIYAMFAQSESETKSIAIKWGIRNRFAKGTPAIVNLYGYHRAGKNLCINPFQAEVVRSIYEWFRLGLSIGEIRELLHNAGIVSPKGLEWWSYGTILYALTNERYAGDVIMQKTFVADIFTHKSVKNVGQLPQYSCEGYHDAIIPKDEWLAVQKMVWIDNWDNFFDTGSEIHIGDGLRLRPVKTIGGIDS